jgi:hypothetical protein
MPQTPSKFYGYSQTATVSVGGDAIIQWQPNGASHRITNLSVKVSTSTAQSVCTLYKGVISAGNRIEGTNSGSTGDSTSLPVDLLDGEILWVVWTGADAGATATAVFAGKHITYADQGQGLEGEGFANPIAAGDGSLIYPALKSPNFVAGTSGWSIKRDGSAEFNNIVVRGTFSANNGLVTVDNNGLHVIGTTERVDITPTFGVIVNEVPSSGGQIALSATAGFGGIAYLQPVNSTNGNVFDAGQIYAARDVVGAVDTPYVKVRSPDVQGNANTSQVILFGRDSTSTLDNSHILFVGRYLQAGPDFTDIGLGMLAYSGDAGDAAPVGNTLSAVLATPFATFRANRAYECRMTGRLTPSAVNMSPGMVLISNIGTTLHTYGRLSTPTLGQYTVANSSAVFTVGSSDLSRAVSLQLISNTAGQTVTHNGRRWIEIYDVGPASNYPDAAVMV